MTSLSRGGREEREFPRWSAQCRGLQSQGTGRLQPPLLGGTGHAQHRKCRPGPVPAPRGRAAVFRSRTGGGVYGSHSLGVERGERPAERSACSRVEV